MITPPEISKTLPCLLHDGRIERLEDAVVKLTDVLNDFNRQAGSDSQRLNQHDKDIERIHSVAKETTEFARSNNDKLNVLISQFNDFKEVTEETSTERTKKLTDIEELLDSLKGLVYKALGGITVIAFLISYGKSILGVIVGGK